MRTTRMWAASSALALATFAFGSAAQASPMDSLVTYNAVGQVGITGTSGPSAIGFDSHWDGSLFAPGYLDLGSFTMVTPNPGIHTTYTNTPFWITFSVKTIDGNPAVPNQGPILLSGVLNGSMFDSGYSNVMATFNPNSSSQKLFQVGNFEAFLGQINALPLRITPDNGGKMSVLGQLTIFPIPEPSSLAVFVLAGLGGMGLYRRSQRAA